MGAQLIKGRSKDNVYEWLGYSTTQVSNLQGHISTKSTFQEGIMLGHPSIKILHDLVSHKSIEVLFPSYTLYYNSCLYNKCHHFYLGVSSLTSRKLDLIYRCFGPAPIPFVDGFYYHVFFFKTILSGTIESNCSIINQTYLHFFQNSMS